MRIYSYIFDNTVCIHNMNYNYIQIKSKSDGWINWEIACVCRQKVDSILFSAKAHQRIIYWSVSLLPSYCILGAFLRYCWFIMKYLQTYSLIPFDYIIFWSKMTKIKLIVYDVWSCCIHINSSSIQYKLNKLSSSICGVFDKHTHTHKDKTASMRRMRRMRRMRTEKQTMRTGIHICNVVMGIWIS